MMITPQGHNPFGVLKPHHSGYIGLPLVLTIRLIPLMVYLRGHLNGPHPSQTQASTWFEITLPLEVLISCPVSHSQTRIHVCIFLGNACSMGWSIDLWLVQETWLLGSETVWSVPWRGVEQSEQTQTGKDLNSYLITSQLNHTTVCEWPDMRLAC